jgi:DNA-binding NarL/FixJ family response regulator
MPEMQMEMDATPFSSLTRREREVIDAVVCGLTNREVARELGISEQTVKNNLSTVFDKLRIRNRLELALLAVHSQLGVRFRA